MIEQKTQVGATLARAAKVILLKVVCHPRSLKTDCGTIGLFEAKAHDFIQCQVFARR